MTTQDVLDRYFKDDKTLYFQQSDAHRAVAGDTYLRYRKSGGVELWLGGDEGEVCVLHTQDGDVLEQMIKLIMHAR